MYNIMIFLFLARIYFKIRQNRIMHIENLQENVKIEMRLILREILCLGVVKRIH